MSEDNNIETNQETTIDIVISEYEERLAKQKEEYENKISDMQTRHIQEIRTLMKTGTSPQAEEIKQEMSVEEQALENLRKKYKIKK